MDNNYFSSGDLADLFEELKESQEAESKEAKEKEDSPEMEAFRRRYQEIMKKHGRDKKED